MMDSVAKCFNRLQERCEKVLEAKTIYRDDLDMTLPLNESEVSSVDSTKKKSRCLQRAKRIDQSLRFEREDEEGEQKTKPMVKPRKVVRFQLENNKIIEPKKTVRFDDDQELEPKEISLDEKEGLNMVEGKEKVVRVKIKMTKQEAQRLLSKCENDCVLDFEHVVDQIANVPVHQLQVAMVVVPCNYDRQGNGCWLSKLE